MFSTKLPPQQSGIKADQSSCPDHWQFMLVSAHPRFGNSEEIGGFPNVQEMATL
jgi:hypothetical protein